MCWAGAEKRNPTSQAQSGFLSDELSELENLKECLETDRKLSRRAIGDLKAILQSELGIGKTKSLSDEDLEQAGLFLLSLTAQVSKGKIKFIRQ